MQSFHLILLSVVVSLAFGCNNSDFAGATGGSSQNKDKNSKKSQGDEDGQNTDDPTSGSESGDEGGDESRDEGDIDLGGDISKLDPLEIGDEQSFDVNGDGIMTDDEIIKLRQACWFAVSGTWGGALGYYPTATTSYPKGSGGEMPSHGVRFDTLGGVFLNARDEPYVYKQGGKEIDGAVSSTFDSISIAPNMKAELRDSKNAIIATVEGPYLGIETQYAGHASKVIQATKDRADMPKWYRTLIKQPNPIKSLKLQSARSVKVTAVPGSRCDAKQ